MKEKRRDKKKLTTLIALLMCAILAFGIAGSLAYYTSVSEKITNVFSYDSSDNEDDDEGGACVSITLSETITDNYYNSTENVAVGDTAYIDLEPGSNYTKTATVTVNDDSIDCYVFLLVENTLTSVVNNNDYLKQTYAAVDDATWSGIKSYGDYTLWFCTSGTYSAGDSVGMNITIEVSKDVTSALQIRLVENTQIVFYAYAIQSDYVDKNTAQEAAISYYNGLLGLDL